MSNLLYVVLIVAVYGLYLLWLRRSYVKKPRNFGPVSVKKMDPPQDDIMFLSKYGFDAQLADEMWKSIRESTGNEDFFTTRLYARRVYTMWYLKLSTLEQKQYDWSNRNNSLQTVIERRPDYWESQGELLAFVMRVRSYAE